MFYPIGNTKISSVFHTTPETSFEALFLGCGDARNVLATAADAGLQRALSLLTVHINDSTRQIIARAALLLVLADEIDPGCKEDINFLWAVWYCLDLSPAQNTRLKHYLERLLAKDYSPRLDMSFCSGEEAVRGVWRGWIRLANGGARSPQAIRRERQGWMVRHVAGKPNLEVTDFQGAVDSLATTTLVHVKPFMPSERLNAEAHQRELKACLASGSMHLGLNEKDRTGWVANSTLLHPDTGAWEVHYHSTPYPSFIPFDQGEDIGSGRSDPHKLARVCMRKFTELIAGFQACAKRVRISVRLWVMDAIVCCDSGLPEDQLFDAVDTSNLADNAELLNLLLMAGPRLKRKPFSRLYARTMIWQGSLRSYLDSSLGVPPAMMPALLGLRLLTDPTLGHPPYQLHPPLERAPALESTTGLHMSPSGETCGVREALRALASRCCRPNTSDSNLSVSNVLIALTPLSLALTVVSAATRIAGIIDASEDWRANADALFRILSIPSCMRMEWNAWMCWLLHDRVAPAPQQAQGQGPDVYVYGCRLQMMAMYTGALGAPMLRVVLMDGTEVMHSILTGSASMGKTFLGDHNQQLNSVCFDTATHEVAFLLQGRSPPRQMTMMLVNMCQQLPLSAVIALDTLKPRQFLGVPPPCARGPLASSISYPFPLPQLALKSVVEHASHYLSTMLFDLDAKADGLTVEATRDELKYSPAPSVHGACISMPGFYERVSVRLAWPVNLGNHKLQRSRKRGLLMCTLPKAGGLWPGDADFLPKMAPHGLPEVPSQEVLSCAMAFMFDDMDSAMDRVTKANGGNFPLEKGPPKDPIEAALHEVRETIQIMFVMGYQKQVQNHVLEIPGDTRNNKIQIIVHKKIRILPDGRPLLQISYVDELDVLNCKPDMESLYRSLDRFQRANKRFVAPGLKQNHVKCTAQELEIFREMLMRNCARTIPSKAQSEVLGLPKSEWRASFLVPLFFQRHDTKGGSADPLKPSLAQAMNSMQFGSFPELNPENITGMGFGNTPNGAPKPAKKPEPKHDRPAKKATPQEHRPTKLSEAKQEKPAKKPEPIELKETFSRNWSSHWKRDFQSQAEDIASASLEVIDQTKQVANQAFKNGSYAVAGGHYRSCMFMLEQMGRPEDPAHREMLKSLHLNMAALNLKLSEGGPSEVLENQNPSITTRGGLDDTGFLEEAVVQCNHALEIEATNAKALYRHAQAMVRLGLDAVAEERLEKAMMQQRGDPAMQALMKGIRKRLSKSKFERL